MDNKETAKPRRPLPTPGSVPAQRPNTPIPGALNLQVPPSSFYGAPKPPTRSATVGSSFTTYIPPEKPPAYTPPPTSSSFREPELVTEDTMDTLPAPTPANSWDHNNPSTSSYWTNDDDNSWNETNDWVHKSTVPEIWPPQQDTYDPMNSFMVNSGKSHVDVTIDGRDEYEEKRWWDPAYREKENRPGPGMLPPVLAEHLHNPDHTLFSVSATPPEHKPRNPVLPAPALQPSETSAISQAPSTPTHNAWSSASPQTSPVPSTSAAAPAPPPPTDNDVRMAIPHPNAYYCSKENGWVILSWKSSSISPPVARSFRNSLKHHPLPELYRRRRTVSCTESLSFEPANKTHHFHRYEKAADAHKLTPAFRMEEWELEEHVKQKRRAHAITQDIDIGRITPEDLVEMDEVGEVNGEEGKLLDLYVCCQCSVYCVASGILPGVIPRKCFDEFVRDKRSNPQPGKSGEQSVAVAFETLLQAIEGKIWKGENRLLRTDRTAFQSKLGWTQNTKRTFEYLGFKEEAHEDAPALRPPPTDITSAIGRMNRRRLLRAWVEIGAWLADYKRVHSAHFKELTAKKNYVQIESAREMYQNAIGAHPDQIPRGELSEILRQNFQLLPKDWQRLGLTPNTYSPELLAFAYYAQVRCDPSGTIDYFTSFSNIVNCLQSCGDCPQSLLDILATERSRDRFTQEDLQQAAAVLGFGPEGTLRVDYDEADVPEHFLENAWKECIKRSWKDAEKGTEMLRSANEAFRMLAEARGSETLKMMWENEKDKVMTPEKAYDTLEVPKDVEDFMLITVYNMRMEEGLPSQRERMKDAMTVIAEVRDSQRLRQFLEQGQDPGEIIEPIRPDLPRGLNQLGNTCYLNSLLQYFYTIKDLREAVLPMSKLDLKSVQDERLSDDDLKRHRVGGRLVTRREIIRSKKFINQLAELFFSLEYAEAAAITPSIDLAKLALVTSRDEEEDEADKCGTDSSNDTDATLVDDVPSRLVASEVPIENPRSPTRSPNSVLGKRSRNDDRQPSVMDLDSPAPIPSSPSQMDFTSSSRASDSPPPLMSPGSPPRMPEASGSGSQRDVEMRDVKSNSKPPPLPPRKTTQNSDSVMMFGKQHDVAECMDNCMFQIETALLRFDGISEQSDSSDKTSVVKRLFYGKIRQRLTGPQPSRSSVHEKEDLFSHLPVNVTDDGVDIYDGLSGYFDDVVEFNGEKRRMEVTLVDLPPVLQIQLQRVQFNRETLQPYKSQAYVKFGETIYMDRFMDNADPVKMAQSKTIQASLNACRERVRQLLEGKDGPCLAALENTATFATKLGADMEGVDEDLVFQLNDEQSRLKSEIDELRARIDKLKDQLEAVWRDSTGIAYELTSVFVHRGSSPSFGHYFFYSRHLPGQPDSWFKYNDSDVTVVPKEEVLADTTGSTANPYLLVFARKGSEVVDTVKRFDITSLPDDGT